MLATGISVIADDTQLSSLARARLLGIRQCHDETIFLAQVFKLLRPEMSTHRDILLSQEALMETAVRVLVTERGHSGP